MENPAPIGSLGYVYVITRRYVEELLVEYHITGHKQALYEAMGRYRDMQDAMIGITDDNMQKIDDYYEFSELPEYLD